LPELPAPPPAGTNKEARKPAAAPRAAPASWPAPQKSAGKIRLDGYIDAVWAVAFSPDGRYTLTTGRRNFLHDRSDYRAVRSHDSRHALTGDLLMRGIILWDVESGKVVRRYGNPARRGRVLNAGFSPDGKYVAASEWEVVRVYDKQTGEVVMTAQTEPGSHPGFAFTTKGRLLAITPDARAIRTYQVKTGKEAALPLLSPARLWTLASSPDGKTVLATRTDADDVLVWKAGKQHPVRRLVPRERAERFENQQAVFLPDGRRALATTMDGTMTLWDVPAGRQLRRWSGLGSIVSLAVSPGGRWALCGLFAERQAVLVRLPDPVTPEKLNAR
jgi:WD40 repeat protein